MAYKSDWVIEMHGATIKVTTWNVYIARDKLCKNSLAI
jgi:hypothetical protein